MTPCTSTPNKARDAWLTHTASILSLEEEYPCVFTCDLSLDTDYSFAPGQFNMLYLPGVGEVAISVSDDPARNNGLRHTIRAAGRVTREIQRMRPGDTMGLRGPFGRGWPVQEAEGKDVVVVAGGIGLAPLRPVIYEMVRRRESFGQVHLLIGARSPTNLLYTDEYPQWNGAGITTYLTVDRGDDSWNGDVGVVTILLQRLKGKLADDSVLMCCGPETMMRYTIQTARQIGIRQERCWVSMERNMQCAAGLCGHCQLGPEFVCKDGPVFRYDEIANLINVEGL